MRAVPLDGGWSFKERDAGRDLAADLAAAEGWLPATVPGSVQQDLIAAGRLADPFEGLNEEAAQWVGERDWLYRCAFDAAPDLLAAGAVDLCCDGLDTVATVWLNGREVLASDNMFILRRVPVTALLRPGRNELAIHFQSALRVGQAREAEHGRKAAWNGDPSRVYVRKAQYHWGWDWGPCLLTAGPWRPIRLEAYRARLAELHAPATLADDLAAADIAVTARIETADGADRAGLRLRLELLGPEGEQVDAATLPLEGDSVHRTFNVARPRLWWPRGYGEQPLYRLVATLEGAGGEPERRELRLGLRRLLLAQQPLEGAPGTSFVFVCNGTPIFCGGANWIPADSFLPRLTPARYRALVQQAAEANMVMLRVWGGGIYEDDAFYDACDALGLLVWQDFMFACGMYPAYPAFRESVRAEAAAQVRRLRHHPCLALWCGNNEDYQVAESVRAYDPAFQGDLAASPFPGRALYERVLPAVCAELDPDRPYWPGSPYGGSRTVNDPTVGDRHVWDVWHGAMAEYAQYARFAGRFVSEFGMQGLPDPPTIAAFAPPEERYGQSRTLEFHNKAGGGARRLAVYLADSVRAPADFPGYLYATQFVQAEALGAAIRDWRRRWGGPGHELVAGALVWQLDDCWPGVSWAVVDYYGRPKPAYYTIRRALAPLALGLALDDGRPAVWAVNGRTTPVEAALELRAWTLDGELLSTERRPAALPPNRATELGAVPSRHDAPVVLGARLLAGEAVLARAALWPEPFKYLTLPDPGIAVDRLGPDRLRLTAQRPAKGVLLSAGDGVRWGDNMLDLQPGDPQVIEAPGLAGAELRLHWLGAAEETRVGE